MRINCGGDTLRAVNPQDLARPVLLYEGVLYGIARRLRFTT